MFGREHRFKVLGLKAAPAGLVLNPMLGGMSAIPHVLLNPYAPCVQPAKGVGSGTKHWECSAWLRWVWGFQGP